MSQTETIELLEECEKTEMFDVEFARQLKNDPNIPKEDRLRLSRYTKRCENVNHVKVGYKLGRKVRSESVNIGRLIAEKGESLQCFPHDIRAALAERYYWDIDVVNAQPTLILQYCEKAGLECMALRRYVECREAVLDEMVRNLGIERWEAKKRVVSLYFGGSSEGLTPFLTRDLQPEARRIVENVWKTNYDTLKWLKKEPNHMGRGMAYIFQTEERKVLLAIDRALTKRGRSMDVLIHDGGLVRKKDGETEFPSRILKEVEADVKAETGYTIRLALKPLETTIEREGDADGDYKEKKRQFEETGWKGAIHFKVRHPPCFIALCDDAMEQMCKGDLEQNEQNNILADGTPFTKKWLTDPEMKEYQKVVFAPKQEVPEGCFNVWRGFRNQPKEGDYSPFQEVLRILSNGDPKVFDYIENYFAHILQKPYQRTDVSIIVQGEQGVGKDTYFDGIGGILGDEYYHSTKTPENDVFAKFNSTIARKLVIKFEEADFKTNKENASKLKGLITEEKTLIEKKNKDPIKLDNLANILMTTNHDVPVVLEETDRRFVLIQASSEKRGDTEFWKRIHGGMGSKLSKRTDVCSAYHHYLLHKDISTFNPHDRPITQFYKDVKQSFIPYHARYFQRTLELDPERTETLEWSAHTLFSAMKQSAPVSLNLSETRFGRDMRLYESVLTKQKQSHSNLYRTDPAALRTFLVQKGWWVDY